jgi:catabolite regulation protein CreA
MLSSSSPVGGSGAELVVRAAEDRRQVANIPASGLVFKDSINIEAFRDPKVRVRKAGTWALAWIQTSRADIHTYMNAGGWIGHIHLRFPAPAG